MKLKSFGCSFIFGTDLSDNPAHLLTKNPLGQFSKSAWPALLAKKLNLEYQCYARPGSGNLQIAERVLTEVCNNDPDFYIIGWTFIDRFDYHASNDSWQSWKTITPGSQDQVSNHYFKNLHSEYQDKLMSLIYLKSTIDNLNQKNKRFLMTYMDNLIFDQQWHMSPAIKSLQEFVKPYMLTFEGMTFLDWSRHNNFAVSESWHPLEQAHQAAADYMIKIFDKQKTNVLALQAHA